MNPLTCDGCGRPASAEHLALRIARLERATRFRPIHIQLLFIAEAPPVRMEDELYAVANGSHPLLEALGIAAGSGIPSAQNSAGTESSERLATFQRLGLNLVYLVECALETSGLAQGIGEFTSGSSELVRRFAPTLLKRIRFSYRPRRIALLSPATRALIPVLEQAGLGEALLLNGDAPLELPERGDRAGALAFRTLVESGLAGNGTHG